MKFQDAEFRNVIGSIVKFLKPIEQCESEIDEGMIGKLVEVKDRHDDVIELVFDMSEFMEHNRSKMKVNYYDEKGKPTLTAEQANCWPDDNKVEVYLMTHNTVEKYFTFDPKAFGRFGAEYLADRVGTESYTAYLERRLAAVLGADGDPI